MAPRQRTLASEETSSSFVVDSTSSESLLQSKRVPRKSKPATLNQTEADIARDWHDYFNLVALVFIIATTAMNYNVEGLLAFDLEGAWTGNHFWLNWGTTLVYFLIDLAWVARVPICVKSPGVIIKHHIVAMIYLGGPVWFPEYSWFMGSILSVEINTWFLILRRVVFKGAQQQNPSKAYFWFTQSVSGLFYLTWILIRCLVYPAVLVTFFENGRGSDRRDWNLLAFAHDFHSSSFRTVRFESQVDL